MLFAIGKNAERNGSTGRFKMTTYPFLTYRIDSSINAQEFLFCNQKRFYESVLIINYNGKAIDL